MPAPFGRDAEGERREEGRREGGIIETGRKIIEPIHKLIEATRSTESASDTIVTARPPKPRVTIPQPKVPHPTVVTARTPKQIAKVRVNANVCLIPTTGTRAFSKGRPQNE